jgi:hypothetical protein
VPADSYTIYGEVRGAGQVIRSSALTDLLEPILKLSGPPKEFKTVVKWLNAHSEEVMTSRLLVAAWPTVNAKQAPQTLIAIEFASADEATKFAGTLNEFLPTIMPAPTPEPPKSGDTTATASGTWLSPATHGLAHRNHAASMDHEAVETGWQQITRRRSELPRRPQSLRH